MLKTTVRRSCRRMLSLTFALAMLVTAAAGLKRAEASESLGQDPRLQRLVTLSLEMRSELEQILAQRPSPEAEAILALPDFSGFANSEATHQLLEQLGVRIDRYTEASELGWSLADAYGLQEMPPETSQALVETAIAEVMNRLRAPAAHLRGPWQGVADNSDCLEHCQFLRDFAVLQAWVLFFVGVGSSGGNPMHVFVLVIKLEHARIGYDDCIRECENDVIDNGECDSDSDCRDHEFCFKGILGIGQHECRRRKDMYDACIRDGQCMTGCCLYDPLVWLLHPVCREDTACL